MTVLHSGYYKNAEMRYNNVMKISHILKLIFAIVVSELTGVVGSIFTVSSIATWYTTLVRPSVAPPNWIFAPVWTTLFALMGIAAFIIWNKGLERRDVRNALGVFVVQLILNVFWSSIFFGMQNPGAAFAEIIVLWLAILMTTISFAKISKLAAWLLVPYIIWVTFAAYLNYAFWILN